MILYDIINLRVSLVFYRLLSRQRKIINVNQFLLHWLPMSFYISTNMNQCTFFDSRNQRYQNGEECVLIDRCIFAVTVYVFTAT